MKKVSSLLLLLVILAGCSPQRRLARLLDRHPEVMPMDTVYKDSIVYRDTTVYVDIPGDTVERYIELEVPVDLPDTSIIAEANYARATAGLSNNRLWLELVEKDTIFPIQLDSVIVVRTDTTTIYVDRPVEIKPRPVWRTLTFTFGGILLVAMALLFWFLTRKK